MPFYVRLVNATEQGVRNIQRMGDMLAESRKVWEAHGCRIAHAWSTLGPYDMVAVIEGPDDATVMKVSALVAKAGNFRAITMPAVTTADFAAALK